MRPSRWMTRLSSAAVALTVFTPSLLRASKSNCALYPRPQLLLILIKMVRLVLVVMARHCLPRSTHHLNCTWRDLSGAIPSAVLRISISMIPSVLLGSG
ncbi:hypothetical protein BDW75DRAFT_205224 [Aspergillus navahoensis]